jgi:hypothetical protein
MNFRKKNAPMHIVKCCVSIYVNICTVICLSFSFLIFKDKIHIRCYIGDGRVISSMTNVVYKIKNKNPPIN